MKQIQTNAKHYYHCKMLIKLESTKIVIFVQCFEIIAYTKVMATLTPQKTKKKY
jgi:hypothetical protein